MTVHNCAVGNRGMPSHMRSAITHSVTGMAGPKEGSGIAFSHALLQLVESEASSKRAPS